MAPDSAAIPDHLLEPDGIFQNRTIAVGVTVQKLDNGSTRLAVSDMDGEGTILLHEQETRHLVTLLSGVSVRSASRSA